MLIRWERFDPARIERAVQMLLKRLHPSVQGIDGSGGDDGQDIRWEDGPGGLTIFEVKSFTSLLTTSQKRQALKSLKTARTNNSGLKAWIMVLPKLQTPGEQRWFTKVLTAAADGVDLEWRGKDWLDEQFAAHQDLRRFLEGDDFLLLERAREMNMEAAVFANGLSDLVSRQETLETRADELSPFWKFRVSTSADGTRQIAVSEKYPGASKDDPIAWNLQFNFDPADPSHQQVRQHLDKVSVFGGNITVPAANVTDHGFTASEETRRLLVGLLSADKPGDIEISSIADTTGLPITAEVVLLEEEPSMVVRRRLPVVFRKRFLGGGGVTLIGSDAAEVLQLQLRVTANFEPWDGSSFDFSLQSCAGKRPDEALPALDLLADAEDLPGARLGLHTGPRMTGVTEPFTGQFEGVPWLREQRELIRSLARLQEHCECILPVPDSYTLSDLAEWTRLARLADGDRVQSGESIGATIQEGHVGEFLTAVADEPAALYVTTGLTFRVGDVEADFGTVGLYCASTYVANRQELVEHRVATGPAQAIFAASEGEHFYWMLPGAGAEGQSPPRATDGPVT